MNTPLPYIQLIQEFTPHIQPKDKRHLNVFAEIVTSILLSSSACLSHWLPFLSHRHCNARSHMARLSYFIHNQNISSDIFYQPLLQFFLHSWNGLPLTLVLDTSMLWQQFCLIEVSLIWGGRSITVAQKVIKHRSAAVAVSEYLPVLEMAQTALPDDCQITLLADRGFEHRDLINWLTKQKWSWLIRAKSDLIVTLKADCSDYVSQLCPPTDQVYLFNNVQVLEGSRCNLAIANSSIAKESWAVLTNEPISLQTFAIYGQRFGGIEPHFKDYKSGAFEVIRSRIRNPWALTNLFMLLSVAQLISIYIGLLLTLKGKRSEIDWHSQRGLSFLQLGLREIQRILYQRLLLPSLRSLPRINPPVACGSKRKRKFLDYQIEFQKVVTW